jgi:hypothetical protein
VQVLTRDGAWEILNNYSNRRCYGPSRRARQDTGGGEEESSAFLKKSAQKTFY